MLIKSGVKVAMSNTLYFLLIDHMMVQFTDQAMDPVKAQAMDLEKDLDQVRAIYIKVLRNNNV